MAETVKFNTQSDINKAWSHHLVILNAFSYGSYTLITLLTCFSECVKPWSTEWNAIKFGRTPVVPPNHRDNVIQYPLLMEDASFLTMSGKLRCLAYHLPVANNKPNI